MKRCWEWPILDWVKGLESDDRAAILPVWFFAGLFAGFLPAALVSRNKHGYTHMTPVLLWTLVGWLGPLVVVLLVIVVPKVFGFAKLFVPKRVTEPVREDLRSRYR